MKRRGKMIKNGIWCEYEGTEYLLWRSYKNRERIDDDISQALKFRDISYAEFLKRLKPGDVVLETLFSPDCKIPRNASDVFHDKSGRIGDEFAVPKSQLTKAYRYHTGAVYKGIKCDVQGNGMQESLFLQTDEITPDNPLIPKLLNCGFNPGYPIGYGTFLYEQDVSASDPEIEIFENCTEIDLNAL